MTAPVPEGPERGRRRPNWTDYFMRLALLAATRSTCPRRHVGALLVRDRRVIATGYNGSVSGDVHCEDVGCLIVDKHCVRTVHAELNALLQCATTGQTSVGADLYATDFPCVHCAKALVQARIASVLYLSEYPDEHSGTILRRAGIGLYRVRKGHGGYEVEESPALPERT